MLRRVCRRAASSQARARSFSPRTANRMPNLRLEDKRINVLLSNKTTSDSFVFACRALRCKDETTLLAATDPSAWNVALQRRLEKRDERGAAELLGLVANFARENASEPVWTDLLFTVLRQRSSRGFRKEEIYQLLGQLKKRYGPEFVARVLVGVINGCANIKMTTAGHELLLYHQKLWPEMRENELGLSSLEPLMPPSVVGHLMTKMVQKKEYKQGLSLAAEYFTHPEFDAARDFQQQGFLALFEASVKAKVTPRKIVRTFLDYVDGSVRTNGNNLDRIKRLQLEQGFGAAIQCCVTLEEFSLALHCYSTMESTRERIIGRDDLRTDSVPDNAEEKTKVVDKVIPVDENMYVNVMKACMALQDFSMLKDAFRGMAARGVGRSGGFGSAIRYCHEHLDATFLEEVLEEVSTTEQELGGAWMLEVENYNDALGCLAATGKSEQAKELFSQMLNNPFIVPDHITMLEMVENHRDASIEEVFSLMDVFLEWKLAPNLQVFTSLLSICMRRRLVGDAVALIDAMEMHGVVLDVKAFTTIAFIQASHGDLKAVVGVLRDMATMDVAADKVFFDYVINALYGSCGIDTCFALFRELSQENLAIPEGLYVSLIDLGTQIGLIERTLHIAYNMECEGFQLSSEQLRELMVRCQSETEISEFVRTFSLLHQGLQPETPRFEVEMYEDLISILTKFNRRNEVSKLQKLARTAGHDDLIV
ncbi:Pentatricopeptide repeat-containing protein [Phytophthora nicotianae]|uniref:40S ribosomal protein S2 n=1 Tax=Phytophthora nicotianae TaxID=4792 RepID=A0A0W8CBN5_PHYNI|nr:Pentatricopeptide repeat-containing protein [Phytophthora nicotianae]KUF87866.1 40S ribosomal protein S2 [Phytophthora nicotianae]